MKASHSLAKEMRTGRRKRDQATGDGEGPSESKTPPLKYGYVSILGRRRVMEDPVMVMPPQKLPGGYLFFAAYGCGGGAKVAETCTEKLHRCLEKHTETEGLGWGKVVTDFFRRQEAAADRMLKLTAVVVEVEKGEVVVVNFGGSRAVLWSGGVALPLWTDHSKADDSDGTAEAEGGTIMSGNDELVSTSTPQGGDECVRASRSSEPDVRVMRRNDGESEDFLIIASDGLWKVVGEEMACEVVRKCLGGKIRRLPSEGGTGVTQATAMLAELAIAKGSKDNIAIVVLQLNSSP